MITLLRTCALSGTVAMAFHLELSRTSAGIPGGMEEGALLARAPLEENKQADTSEMSWLWADAGQEASSILPFSRQSVAPTADLLRQLAIPTAALLLGGGIHFAMPQHALASQLLLFFGAQCFMNIYMKAILSNSVVSAELHMRGFQAPLILTALQQLVGFVVLLVLVLASQFTPWPYKPQSLKGVNQYITLIFLAGCFTLNIALNNFSLSLLDMSVNVMIRSTSPLISLMLQLVFRRWFVDQSIDLQPAKLILMLVGIALAVLVVVSKRPHGATAQQVDPKSTMGLILCCASLLFSSLELIVVVIIGKGFKMNSIDTLLYMAIPVFVLLLLPSFFVKHPVAYQDHASTTDFHVLLEVARLNFGTVILVLLSGVFSLGYNLLLYNTVRHLSPYFASFAANFNKIAAVGLSLLLGFEHLPQGPWGVVMILGVLGNMASFTAYSLWPKFQDQANAAKKLGLQKDTGRH